jgi:hypothetical protein
VPLPLRKAELSVIYSLRPQLYALCPIGVRQKIKVDFAKDKSRLLGELEAYLFEKEEVCQNSFIEGLLMTR